ncbi:MULTISPECIES: nicotinate-nucleotide adenylyltransferase [unclassified Gemella]|uniref:nicotinate-nucleotide adenylyltransferase n=1 Tax=unclassified Gemella TaxID=2624949 RepID=UPI001C044383|nr:MULTISPECIES: nicotinate-nucleotide adenylyltransferase [unclassified Gemella]MBU0278653.1 nicotinate-nucleotide adenylyltransferase [Gemella sp. zg-1178]QWQ39209.1 nicotinate-nucleotide adenylyltransferase [Gemella sp. zg-570]
MKKIALYGGSFDPVHIGHLITASNVVEDLAMDKLIFIPSNKTPLKNENLKASNKDRYNMLVKSISKNKKFSVSSYEIDKNDISYTYYTIKYFKEIYTDASLYFIIGTDRVKDLKKWHRISELSKMVTFIFVARNEEKLEEIISKDTFYKEINYVILKSPVIEISSTDIRNKLKNKKNISYLVDKDCANYIEELSLYEF